MQADEPNAAVIPNSNYFPGRNGLRPQWIIVHGTAGGTSAEAIARYFSSTQGTANPVSSHYIVGQDGEIVQCVSERDGAWANGVLTTGHDNWWNPNINPNNTTISIEHCKTSADNSDALTQPQQQASFALIKDICARWGIPMQPADGGGGITGHFSLDPINRRNCPGPYPWDQLWDVLKEGTIMSIDLNDPVVRQYFEDAGNGTWKCKSTGAIIQGGILKKYQTFGGDAKCGLTYCGLPLTNEVVLGIPNHPEITMQRFERAVWCYDPNRILDNPPDAQDIYAMHLYGGSPAQDPQVAALQAQVAQLQQQKTAPATPPNDQATMVLEDIKKLLVDIGIKM